MQTRKHLAAATLGMTVGLGTTVVSIAQDVSGPLQEVIVTGSRIARPNLESAVPVQTISAEELYKTGNTSVGDLLNELPALRSTFSQANSTRFLGTTGLNLLDLRGLGTQRTLVLVNGRRHVGSDILNNAVSPDTNTFPTDLIERIDVVTGGNSAVYGSDAIAGVVNFVLKKNFEGMEFRGQLGQSSKGDGEDYSASAVYGVNFWEDRGNIAFNLEYARQEEFFATDRENLRRPGGFVASDSDPVGSVNGSDGIPDRFFFSDIRAATFSDGGTVVIQRAASPAAPCGRDSQGRAYGCTFIFQPDGTLVPQTGTRVGLAPGGNFIGGNGTTGREGRTFGILPELERVSFNVFGNVEVNDYFKPFIEAKFVRTDSLSFGAPAFFQGGTIDGDRELIRFDNPFLSDQARGVINQARARVGQVALSGSDQFALSKNLRDLAPRQEDGERETFRVVLGAAGDLGKVWDYEVSFNYGKFEEDTEVLGNLDLQRFVLAIDSARDASGKIVCRSQIDPDAANPYPFAGNLDLGLARLKNDIDGCVPLNPFGEGNISAANRNYLLQNTTSKAEIEQTVVSAVLSGDSSQLFTLPAGPVGLAFGYEHREEKNDFKADDLVQAGLTFYNAIPTFSPPTFKVDEVFSEVRVPLLKELPGADNLSVSAAGRYSDYEGSTGEVFAYNYGLEYSPIQSLRFRTNIAKSIRAPNLVDQFTPLGQNFALPINDPCSTQNIGQGSATRPANCAAQGIANDFFFQYNQSLSFLSGGNPNLKEEEADSFTGGFVFQPAFLPGFSLAIDYFDIDIENVITAPSAQQILNACYDAPTLNNQFCPLFQRNSVPDTIEDDGSVTGNGPSGEIQFQIIEGSLQQVVLNYARSKTRGIDLEASYRFDIPRVGKLTSRLSFTRVLQLDNFLDPANPDQADQQLFELGDPANSFNLDLDLDIDKLTLSYQLRYIGKQLISASAEDVIGVDGMAPRNADFADRKFYPEVFYSDVRADYDFNKQWNFYLGVDNIGDKLPPLGLSGAGGGSGIFEPRGRFLYGGAKYKFR